MKPVRVSGLPKPIKVYKDGPTVRAAVKSYESLPAKIRNTVESQGGQILLAEGWSAPMFPGFEYLMGYHPRGWSANSTFMDVHGVCCWPEAVAISGRVGDRSTALHEIGHLYDGVRDEDTWPDLFWYSRQAEVKNLTSYELQSGAAGASETYACRFAQYFDVEGRKILRRKCPKISRYFDDLVGGVGEGRGKRWLNAGIDLT